ncbi:hypothetical protein HYFRA_00000461 [Hymenoscyphus fraxineus]|uniref:C2H2-type domain-containing protein n=1 Tax=Hymenoscyphus fraxineus TaxID=746836 RepID=A0A9N9PWB0_9HELO|nr:hypothetical protein HYFRA_00000461 [Hymenoscyphus fraxineus]
MESLVLNLGVDQPESEILVALFHGALFCARNPSADPQRPFSAATAATHPQAYLPSSAHHPFPTKIIALELCRTPVPPNIDAVSCAAFRISFRLCAVSRQDIMSEPYSFMNDLTADVDWTELWQLDDDWANAILPEYSYEYSNLLEDRSEHSPHPEAAVDLIQVHNHEPSDTNVLSPAFSLVYLPNECASCDGSLDKSEQDLSFVNPTFYCNRNQEHSHLTIACQVSGCLEKFSDFQDLKKHSLRTRHRSLNCSITGCNAALSASSPDTAKHLKEHHPNSSQYTCVKCGRGFGRDNAFRIHCQMTGHAGAVCQFPQCDTECIRFKDLSRHQLIHKKRNLTYPCTHCRTYRGSNGFKRKDHLVQHMRNYHRMEDYAFVKGYCLERSCYFRYTCSSDLTAHMLEAHHSSAYVCDKPNCDRVGMNGFENKKDLNSHLKKDHISEFQCTHPGCDRIGSNGWKRQRDMVKHMEKVHGRSVDL